MLKEKKKKKSKRKRGEGGGERKIVGWGEIPLSFSLFLCVWGQRYGRGDSDVVVGKLRTIMNGQR